MVLSRRKPFKYKNTRTLRVLKTSRTEIPPETRAFIAGAALLRNISHHTIAATLHRDRSGISKLVKRIQEKAESGGFNLWDPTLFQDNIRRGRPELLSDDQKKEIIRITTQDRDHREQEP
jgi:transposase